MLSWSTESGADFYMNGELYGSAPVQVGAPIFGDNPIVLGWAENWGPEPRHFQGKIDDVYIYDRALSASEVQTLFSSVPEPSTSLLMGIGLIGLSASSLRRASR
jgi:hypothetical protein